MSPLLTRQRIISSSSSHQLYIALLTPLILHLQSNQIDLKHFSSSWFFLLHTEDKIQEQQKRKIYRKIPPLQSDLVTMIRKIVLTTWYVLNIVHKNGIYSKKNHRMDEVKG